MKKLLLIVVLLLIAAAPLKFSFFEVGAPPVDTIEATWKPGKFAGCNYWQASEYTPYEFHLGYYSELKPEVDNILDWCLDNFVLAE